MVKSAVRIGGIIGAYILAFWVVLPGFLWAVGRRLDALIPIGLPEDGWLAAAGWILAASGAALLAGGMGRLWSRGKGLPISHLPPRRFVASGVYRFVRHPIYLGFNLAFAGTALVLGSFWSLAFGAPLLLVGWIAYALLLEEPALIARFKGPYRDYRGSTPLLIPRPVGRFFGRALRPLGQWSCRLLSALARRPILFRRGNLIVVTYGLFAAAGSFLFTQQTTALLIAQGVKKSHLLALHIADVLSASFGAYLFWWLGHRREMIRQPRFGLRNIGYVSFGALAGLLCSCAAFAIVHRYPVGLITDALVRGMFLAYALGRLGCVSYGCCWGTAAPRLGILYQHPQAKVLRLTGRTRSLCRPAQAYSCIEGVVLFAVLNLLPLRPLRTGALTAFALLAYSLGRFFIEFARERTRKVWGRLHEGHISCLVLAAVGFVLLFGPSRSAAVPGLRLWDPSVLAEGLSLVPVSLVVAGLVFIVAGVHWRKVGTW